MRVPNVRFVQGRNDYTDGDGRKYGIAIHNTSNDASDDGEASWATRRPDGVSSHFYVDADSVTQSLDTEDRAGHAGSREGNENAIAFEFVGANGKSRAWWLANIAWDKVGAVIAHLIEHDPDLRGFQVRRASVAEMKANPKIRAMYGHDDMRRAWGDTTHTDPGPNFPWDRLFQAVNNALEDDDMPAEQLLDADAIPNRPWRPDHPDNAKANGVQPNDKVRWEFAVTNTWDQAQAANVKANRILQEQAAARLRDEAILQAVQGVNTAAILTRVEELAAEEAQRDAELRTLLEQHATGQLSAEAVVQALADRLAA